MDRYEEDHWIRDWFDANEEMILLHDALCLPPDISTDPREG